MNISILYVLAYLLLFIILFMLLSGNVHIFSQSFLMSEFNLSLNFDKNEMMSYFNYTVLVLSSFIVIYSMFYMSHELNINRFGLILLIFIVSMLLLNTSDSCWLMWLGWEGLGVTSFLLIIYYTNWSSNNSSVVTLMLNRLGDFSLMMSMFVFCNFLVWNTYKFGFSSWFLIIMTLAMLAKSAQIPLQSWLPMAMAAPTPVSSLVHSSTLVVAGAILCLKLNNYFFCYSMLFVVLLGYLTSLYASFMAFVEQDFKKIMAYSTMSQIALVMFMISSNLSNLVFMHIINHAFVKATLFMSIGIYISYMFGNQEARLLELKISSNMLTTFFMISCLVIMCGTFYSSCFYSKEYALMFCLDQETLFLMVNLMVFLSLAYSLRVVVYLLNSTELKLKSNMVSLMSLINLPLFLVMICNGWFMMYNYSMPFNSNWTSLKKLTMLVPMFIIIASMLMYKGFNIINTDHLYSFILYNLSVLLTSSLVNKIKMMSMSFNTMGLQLSFMVKLKMIFMPMLILILYLLL